LSIFAVIDFNKSLDKKAGGLLWEYRKFQKIELKALTKKAFKIFPQTFVTKRRNNYV